MSRMYYISENYTFILTCVPTFIASFHNFVMSYEGALQPGISVICLPSRAIPKTTLLV